MDEINVEFIGVCTHIQWPKGMPPVLVPHRVILINSEAQNSVAKHHTRVEIWEGDDVVGGRALNGAAVSIDGAVSGAVEYGDHYTCAIPHLLQERFTDSMTLSRRVKEAPDAALVSGLIDLPNGRLRAEMREDGAAVVVGSVQIEGPRQISIRSFEGALVETIPVPAGAVVVFSNTAGPGQEHEDDFKLNFLIADPVPIVNRHNMRRFCDGIRTHVRPPHSIGPGCSNTNFP